MSDFIILTLFFFDFNNNNIFDAKDKIVDVPVNSSIERNVYCLSWNTTKARLCWYSSTELTSQLISETDLNQISEEGKYLYNSEVFEKWFKNWRVLYAEYIDWKFLFKVDESSLNLENQIYSLSNNDGIIFDDLMNKLLLSFGWLLIIFFLWFILLPKDKLKNGK